MDTERKELQLRAGSGKENPHYWKNRKSTHEKSSTGENSKQTKTGKWNREGRQSIFNTNTNALLRQK